MNISVIIPVYNEENNIAPLVQEIKTTLIPLKKTYEIIIVDDGSTDGTLEQLMSLSSITIIRFRKNFGQTAALDAGIKHAQGDIIITIDGDGQNDPADIPRLIDKLSFGFDMVSGWRKNRYDPIRKKISSWCINVLRRRMINDHIHDSGCTLKAFRRECFLHFDLYGDMHRFIPALLAWRGFYVSELIVNHRPRMTGKSKYALTRGLKGVVDMISVWFWRKFSSRPLHVFGGIGLLATIAGTFLLIVLGILRMFNQISLSSSIWPLVGFFLILAGIQLFISGLLADIMARNYFKTHQQTPYVIKETIIRP